MNNPIDICKIKNNSSKVITTAIHSSHQVRKEIEPFFNISSADRLREEDPFTDILASASDTQIIATKSRFEVDLNRPREKAVYLSPQDSWGLQVWKSQLDQKMVKNSLNEYDLFYKEVTKLIDNSLKQHEKIIILDIHSYNHQRNGADTPFDSPKANPDINIGTGTMLKREQWTDIIDTSKIFLADYKILNNHLDVRENIKFRGGNFPGWLHETYPDSVCCLSLEFKKIFMNEWTGQPDETFIGELTKMLQELVTLLDKRTL